MQKDNYKKWIEYLEKGQYSEDSHFLRFAVLWLSLASFLNERYQEEFRESKKLEKFQKEFAEEYKRLVEEDEIFKKILNLEFPKTSETSREFVENLQTGRIEDRDYFSNENIYDFTKFINVIYQIRCNFFHGDKIPFDPEDEKLVLWAYKAFLYFWKYVLNNKFGISF